MSLITNVEQWFEKVFTDVKVDITPIVVKIIEYIKTNETNGVIPAIAAALASVTDNLSTEVNAAIQAEIPKALAAALAIEGLPANPTPAQVEAFETAIITAILGKTALQKSEVWTTLAAKIYAIIQTELTQSNNILTFANIVDIVEKSYQDYLASTTAASISGDNEITNGK
jgi:uncharacterized protein (DUF2267 family)